MGKTRPAMTLLIILKVELLLSGYFLEETQLASYVSNQD